MNHFDLSGGVGAEQDVAGLVFNLDTVEESKGFELLPKGTYSAIVDSFEFGESKSGNPMITVVYSITDPEYENRKLYDYMVLAGDGKDFGLQKLKKFLVRVCPDVNITSFNPQTFSDEGTAIGRECRVMVKIQTQKSGDYKGEKRNSCQDILSPENGSFL
jgi:hypothetical protein